MSDDFLGFNMRIIAAGLSGGAIDAYLSVKDIKVKDVLIRMAVGGLSANYISPSISDMTGTPALVSAFFVGMVGMYGCKMAIAWFRKRFKSWLLSKDL